MTELKIAAPPAGMLPCPGCKTTGQMTIVVSEHGKASTSASITCIHCNGKGYITPKKKAQLDAEDALWCRCGNPSGEATYVPDGEGEIHKHHWLCKDCQKVVQIG